MQSRANVKLNVIVPTALAVALATVALLVLLRRGPVMLCIGCAVAAGLTLLTAKVEAWEAWRLWRMPDPTGSRRNTGRYSALCAFSLTTGADAALYGRYLMAAILGAAGLILFIAALGCGRWWADQEAAGQQSST